MPLPDFHVSEPFTLGIELEMQVVNPPGYDLSQDSSMLIDAVKNKITAGEVKHDITESMLELATDVCRDINQAAGQFSAMQKVVLQAAADHHLEICGGGTHPFQKWQRQEVCDNERYQRTLENFGYLIQQATVFGQHVHVGCASGDDCHLFAARPVTVCAALYRPFRRVAIYARNGYAFCLLTTEYFFRLSR